MELIGRGASPGALVFASPSSTPALMVLTKTFWAQ
jgi:O-glycosyl hydrolase